VRLSSKRTTSHRRWKEEKTGMKRASVILSIVALVAGGLFGAKVMNAQQAPQPMDDKPLNEKWAPTEWGPNDKVGAPNRTTPAIVMKAAW
jgi:hypothetical protein